MNSLVGQESKKRTSFFSSEEMDSLSLESVPHHLAVIMDGNRRWAKQKKLPYMAGHWRGAEALTRVVRAASDLGVKVLTVYSFSTENWTRPSEEVSNLMQLLKIYLVQQRRQMIEEGVRLDTIGDLSRLPPDVREALEESKGQTRAGQVIDLVLAMNYGGRDDIRRAALAIIDDFREGKLSKSELSEERFSQYLDTAKWRDPELIIRTSGEQRLSNFLLWQLSYSEVYITDVLWPDFGEKDLLNALVEYQQRERRRGG